MQSPSPHPRPPESVCIRISSSGNSHMCCSLRIPEAHHASCLISSQCLHHERMAFLYFHFVLQAWWVGDEFFADVWRICTNNTNCTVINDSFQGKCE